MYVCVCVSFLSGFGSVQSLPIQLKSLIRMGCEGVEHDTHVSPKDHPLCFC